MPTLKIQMGHFEWFSNIVQFACVEKSMRLFEDFSTTLIILVGAKTRFIFFLRPCRIQVRVFASLPLAADFLLASKLRLQLQKKEKRIDLEEISFVIVFQPNRNLWLLNTSQVFEKRKWAFFPLWLLLLRLWSWQISWTSVSFTLINHQLRWWPPWLRKAWRLRPFPNWWWWCKCLAKNQS